MNSLKALAAGMRPPVVPPSMRAAATALGSPSPSSLRHMLAARSVEVSFRSYTTPKFWDDDPWGNRSSLDLQMVMTHDRQVGKWHWQRGCLYSPAKAMNAIAMSRTTLERFRDELVLVWDQGIVAQYEQAKDAIVGAVADLVNEPFPGTCGNQCRSYLKQSLEVAMVAVGLPPDLPTSRQLVSAGASYVATQLVDSAAPGLLKGIGDLGGEEARKYAETLDPQVREAARAEIQDQLESGATDVLLPPQGSIDADNPYTWGVPDPLYLARPAVLYVDLKPRPGADPRAARGTWAVEPSAVFAKATFPINYLPPSGVTVPVLLWPSIGRFVRASDARQMGLPYQGWYGQFFGDTRRVNTTPYDQFDKGVGIPFYSTHAVVDFTVRSPHNVISYKSKVPISGQHNISPKTELDAPVFGEVFTLRGAPHCP